MNTQNHECEYFCDVDVAGAAVTTGWLLTTSALFVLALVSAL